jgi:hypothetical protein
MPLKDFAADKRVRTMLFKTAGSGGTAELNARILALAFTRGVTDVLTHLPAIARRSGTGMWNELA